jgi:hypothetical protein
VVFVTEAVLFVLATLYAMRLSREDTESVAGSAATEADGRWAPAGRN